MNLPLMILGVLGVVFLIILIIGGGLKIALLLFPSPVLAEMYQQISGKGNKKLFVPDECVLSQNAPNPFNPETTIEYALPGEAYVYLVLYHPLGQTVRKLVDAMRSSGYHRVVFDGRDEQGRPVSGGVYFYRMTAGTFSDTKRMVLLRGHSAYLSATRI